MVGIMFWDEHGNISDANESFRNGGLHLQDIQEDKLKWNDITPSEYTEIDQNALKQLELTGVCAPFEKNTSEKRKPCKCTYRCC
jgi:hypothetical protein